MIERPLGVLLMAYGTPRSLAEVEPYYTHIRHGRKPSPELLQQLVSRYEAIGGVSPLNEITEREASGLEQVLGADGGREVKVYLGMKHAAPFIADTVAQMKADGIEDAVALVLAPHYSTMSVQAYLDTALEASAQLGGPSLCGCAFVASRTRLYRSVGRACQSCARTAIESERSESAFFCPQPAQADLGTRRSLSGTIACYRRSCRHAAQLDQLRFCLAERWPYAGTVARARIFWMCCVTSRTRRAASGSLSCWFCIGSSRGTVRCRY